MESLKMKKMLDQGRVDVMLMKSPARGKYPTSNTTFNFHVCCDSRKIYLIIVPGNTFIELKHGSLIIGGCNIHINVSVLVLDVHSAGDISF